MLKSSRVRQKHPSCRAAAAKQGFFHESPVERLDQASHGWARMEPAPHPHHGQEDAPWAAPCAVALRSRPKASSKIALGSRWDGLNGKPQSLEGLRVRGCLPVVFTHGELCLGCTSNTGFSQTHSPSPFPSYGHCTRRPNVCPPRGLGAAPTPPASHKTLRDRGRQGIEIKTQGRSNPKQTALIYGWREGGERVERQRRKSQGS